MFLDRLIPVVNRLARGLRWRLGLRVAAPDLEEGTDETIARYYSSRVTDCTFLSDPQHYEYPRARWILERVRGGRLLEVGCGNGGMTRSLAGQVDRLVALDVSALSIKAVRALHLPNVEPVEALIEDFYSQTSFDWVVLSEVIEHLRKPQSVVARCVRWLAPGGSLLVTTPHGHWESSEHLHEFSLESFSLLLAQSGAEEIYISYLRDSNKQRRWLAGQVTASRQPSAPDAFHDRLAIARERRASAKRR